jgi:hypothetical protein
MSCDLVQHDPRIGALGGRMGDDSDDLTGKNIIGLHGR